MSQTKAQLISDLVQALNFTGTSSAPANGMYLSAANTISLSTNSTAGRLTIDSSGNMGLAITPDTQGATVDSLQIGSVTNLYNESSDDYTILGNNIYFDGTNNKYIKTQESSRLMQNAGQFWFQQAGSGSADTNITYTTPLFIKIGGKVGIGTTDPQRTLHLSSNNTVLALTDTAASTDQKTKYILSDAGVFAVGKLNDAYDTAVEHFRIDNNSHATFASTVDIPARRNSGGILETGTSNNWFKIGTISTFGGGNRIQITNLGTNGYGQADQTVGHTIINITRDNGSTQGVRGHFYGVGTTDSYAGLSEVATKPTGTSNQFDVYVKPSGHYSNLGCFVNISTGAATWAGATTDTGSASQPASSTLLQKEWGILIGGSHSLSIDSLKNVGIGTTSPTPSAANYNSASLHIHQTGDSSAGSQIHLTNGATGAAAANGVHISMWSDDDLYITNQESDGKIKFGSGGNSDVLTIDDDAKVGIGTTSPAVSLEVEKTIDVDYSAANSIVVANNLLRLENPSTNNSAFAGMQFRTGDGGDAHFGSYQNSGSANDCTFYWSNQTDTGAKTLATLDTASGDLTINDGDLVIGTAGHGINFSATADGAGSSPDEVFDDYEEGNWTPSYDTSGATGTISNVTYATQVGKYVKIGKMVHIEGTLKTSAITKDQSGTYDIAGLPFPCMNSTAIGGVFTYLQQNWTNAPQSFDVVANTSRMRARQGIDVGSGTYTTANTDNFNTGAGNNNRIYFSGQYRAQ